MDHPEQSANRPVNVAHFCAGFGFGGDAIRLALGDARTVVACEIEAYATSVLVQEMEEGRETPCPLWTNLLTFDGRPWRGVVDLLVAGFPCQGNSVAGKREGVNDERWIWPDIARILREVDPPYALFENVPGLTTVNQGSALHEVLSDLAQMGFDAEYGHLRASDVGAPHRRERWFLFARNRAVVDAEGRGHPGIEALIDWQPSVVRTVAGADGGAPARAGAQGIRVLRSADAPGAADLCDRHATRLAAELGRGDLAHAGSPRLDIDGELDGGAIGSEFTTPLGHDDDGRDPALVGGDLAHALRDGQCGCLREAGTRRRDGEDGDTVGRGRMADAGHSGLAFGGGEPGDVRPECPTAERDGDRLVRTPDGVARRGDLGDAVGRGGERRGGGLDLAGPTGIAQAERLQREWRGRAADDPGAGAMPLFPPGPRSLRWLAVAYHRPDLFPALTPEGRIPESSPFYPFFIAGERARQAQSGLRGVADGRDRDGGPRSYLPDCDCPRTDLLRGYGNGVVPHQEAAMLLVLIARMGWRVDDQQISTEEVQSSLPLGA